MKKSLIVIPTILLLSGCNYAKETQDAKDAKIVQRQQSQYAKAQPIPAYNWSLERELLIKLYNLRNDKVSTHSVWRSQMGTIEGDCTSMGYGLPYDTSLTNPQHAEWRHRTGGSSYASAVTGQSEPNGIYASTNTSATWVMCVDKTGAIEPVYTEAVLNVYPYQIDVDYKNNRVTRRSGSKSIKLK